jgi:hypothetical protein
MKAFRNASGSVVLLAPVDLGSRSLIGPSLGEVRHDCHVYMNSTLDYDMANSADREWSQSPFAFPNGSVYALTHMEYHNESNQMGLWSSVTLLKSSNGGYSWEHALPPPKHIVAAAPYKYMPSGPQSVLFGFRSPSNILKSRTDGFYYAFITAGWSQKPNPVGQRPGACLMRSRDITDPASWRAWGGGSFNISLAVNPYIDPTLQPTHHLCEPITDMTYISLLWSTFFNSYMIVGCTEGNDHIGWSLQLAADLSEPKWGPQQAFDTSGHIKPGGDPVQKKVPTPVIGIWARSINGTVLGPQIWWLSPTNSSKHKVYSCTPCGVPACTPSALHNVPITQLSAIAEGRPFGCGMIGGGGGGTSAYIYPSLMDESSDDANFQTVGKTASLFLVRSECVQWHNASGHMQCTPFDYDGNLRRSVVKVPVEFSKGA